MYVMMINEAYIFLTKPMPNTDQYLKVIDKDKFPLTGGQELS